MRTTDTIQVTRISEESRQADALGRGTPTALTESEFRELLGRTLVALGDTGADGRIAPPLAAAMVRVGEYLAGDQPIGDPDLDYSVLGTFETMVQTIEDENLVPAGAECPHCGADKMDDVEPLDDSYRCMKCETEYSEQRAGGKPVWTERGGLLLFYAPSIGRYVSIPGASR
jgi:DNA-directed RNA polymerase subunit RPC12/RpoP